MPPKPRTIDFDRDASLNRAARASIVLLKFLDSADWAKFRALPTEEQRKIIARSDGLRSILSLGRKLT